MTRKLYWWLLAGILCVFSYLYALDGQYIPSTGDEGPYLQITRLTAATGHWLPLQPAEGLGVTKPPLLFWQGIAASGWGQHWELWRFRLTVVGYTFLTATMVFWVTRRITRNSENAAVAALAFMAFTSIFHHGRPYITNLLEVFFLSASFFGFLLYRHLHQKYWFWLIPGCLVGLSAWSRSIFLLAPVGLAFALYLFWQRQWKLANFVKTDVPRLMVFGVTVLAVFGLWLLLDPDPHAIIREFLLGENVSKLKSDGYWNNFFSGPYPVFAVWFGIFRNAGFLALPLIYVSYQSFRNRKMLSLEETAIWIWIAAFVVTFTIPAQRQDSYIMATMPAVAVLLGIYWQQIPAIWFRLSALPVLLVLAALLYLLIPISQHVFPSGAYQPWHFIAPAGGVILLLLVLFNAKLAYRLIIPSIFTAFIALASIVAPLDGPLGRYDMHAIEASAGKTVYVPTNFRSQYENFYFLLPMSQIKPYAEGDTARRDALLAAGELVVVDVPPESTRFENYNVLGSRLIVRNRMPETDISSVLKDQKMELLFRRELLLKK